MSQLLLRIPFLLSVFISTIACDTTMALSQEVLFQTFGQIHIGDEDINGWPSISGRCVKLSLGSVKKGDQIELNYRPYGLENAFIRFAGGELRLAPQKPNTGQKRPNYWGRLASVSAISNTSTPNAALEICSENVKFGSGQIDYDDFMISNVTVSKYSNISKNSVEVTEIQKIQHYFEEALGVDAENVQLSLLEAGLYLGEIDGVWNKSTRQAFVNALDWSYSRAGGVDLSTERAFYDFVDSIREVFFDEDSGLAQWPTGNSFLLSVMAHRDYNVALNSMKMIDQRLTDYGYPMRARVVNAKSGWFVIAAGMYSEGGCEQQSIIFKRVGIIPGDSYCAPEDKFWWGD